MVDDRPPSPGVARVNFQRRRALLLQRSASNNAAFEYNGPLISILCPFWPLSPLTPPTKRASRPIQTRTKSLFRLLFEVRQLVNEVVARPALLNKG